ncbi:MAG TPA: alpha/beta hydrolase [Allosphingosinicella sp.]|nr:alpha/beta hydrolase [Allosphingosinicella sp.]
MDRRNFIGAALALLLLGGTPSAGGAAPPYQPKRFSVVVKGTGPDVILIPGLTASRDIWSATVAKVPGYRYHLVQVNGFAGTAPGANSIGPVVAPLADEVAAYVRARGLSRPAMVGHSMGGTVAMMVAARHPERVGRVMVVDMLPQPAGLLGSSATGVRGLAESLRGLAASPGGRQFVASLIATFGTPEAEAGASDPDLVARVTHELALTDLTPELAKIAAPLTVVYAAPDRESRAAVASSYRSAYAGKPGAKLIRIDDSGHMIMYDQPARFQAALKAFLAE